MGKSIASLVMKVIRALSAIYCTKFRKFNPSMDNNDTRRKYFRKNL
ncbi:hypothetical protein N9357_02130 [bacterium]|nr:hypothetical protein [bacterium]